jgi:3'-5' exoribonuclease
LSILKAEFNRREEEMESQGLKNYKVGDIFNGYCIIRKKELKYKKNGESYLKMEFGDSTGRLGGKIWSYAQERSKNLKTGQVVKIRGKIQQYHQNKEIHVESVRQVRENEKFMKKKLLPVSQNDVEKLKKGFMKHKASIKDQYLKDLLERIFSNKSFLARYLQMPSGKLWHHQYRYGLLEHLVCIMDLSEIMYHHYPALNLDLLKTGMITYLLGNLCEFDQDGFINYSREGRLLGHALLSLQQLDFHIEGIEGFPEELKIQLYHLIVSNESQDGTPSQVLPMTREAIILAHLMRLDIQANAVERILCNDKLEGSDWTKYNKLFNRFIYDKSISE